MPNSNRWSTGSAPCRLEWRPSRWVIRALYALGQLGALSVLVSEMPRLFAWPLAAISLGYGCWLARREARIPDCRFVWPGDGHGPVTRDGRAVDDMSLHWRGPLAFMRFRGSDGGIRHLGWWPDTLDPHARRELRLAIDRQAASRRTPRMAG